MLRASNRELSAQRSAERTDTEQRVLMEALKLFAAHGFNATSMRMICAAADANPSSVYYYFGSKRGVLRGVCEFLFEPVQRERAELLAKAMAKSAGSQLDLHAILAAFIGPAIRLARHPRLGRLFNRLAGHLSTDPTPDVRTVIARIHDTAARDFIQAVRKACRTSPTSGCSLPCSAPSACSSTRNRTRAGLRSSQAWRARTSTLTS